MTRVLQSDSVRGLGGLLLETFARVVQLLATVGAREGVESAFHLGVQGREAKIFFVVLSFTATFPRKALLIS